jgi:hypothetical protein
MALMRRVRSLLAQLEGVALTSLVAPLRVPADFDAEISELQQVDAGTYQAG